LIILQKHYSRLQKIFKHNCLKSPITLLQSRAMSNYKPRKLLARGRNQLGLNFREAAALAKCVGKTIDNWELGLGRGYPTTLANIRRLCRGYMRVAAELGYEPSLWHESVLCPGEFPEPASAPQDTPVELME
jgi:hypothetical protein